VRDITFIRERGNLTALKVPRQYILSSGNVGLEASEAKVK
jgi:hypothetical protein